MLPGRGALRTVYGGAVVGGVLRGVLGGAARRRRSAGGGPRGPGRGPLRTVSGGAVVGGVLPDPSLARMSSPRTVEARASGPSLSLVAPAAAGAGAVAEARASASVPLEPMVVRGVVFPLIVVLGGGTLRAGGGWRPNWKRGKVSLSWFPSCWICWSVAVLFLLSRGPRAGLGWGGGCGLGGGEGDSEFRRARSASACCWCC